MGYHEYEAFPVPQVVAGFEPEDILLSLLMIARQVENGEAKVENAYPRVVTREGNVKAQRLMQEVFTPTDVEWRGFPVIPDSGLALKPEFEAFDAQKKFDLVYAKVTKNSGCICRVFRLVRVWLVMKEHAGSGISTSCKNNSNSLIWITTQRNYKIISLP